MVGVLENLKIYISPYKHTSSIASLIASPNYCSAAILTS